MHIFLRKTILAVLLVCTGSGMVVGQAGLVQVSGRVIDAVDGHPMAGVNVSIPEKYKGTVTNQDGYFYLRVTNEELPFMIRFSMMGYRTESYEVIKTNTSGLRIRLTSEDIMGEEVVITAPVVEVEQKVFREIKTVELMDALTIREAPAHNYYEALAYMKGVDVTTQSLQFLTINARGFNSTENIRFRQIVDGMDNMAPGLNFPVGNIAGLPELDVETVEFLPGPSTAVYGNNSLNGVLIMTSKDPFQYPGLSINLKPGVADLRPGSDYPFQFSGKPLIDASMRYALVINNSIALKFNTSYMRGRDWYADDTTNIRPGNIYWEWDPGHDGLNQYGDEIMAFMPVGENLEYIPVARTGYKDKDLVDDNVENIKLNGSLHYKITSRLTAILHGNYGKATTVYAGDNRIALSGFEILQAKAELKGENLNIYGYTTRQNAGNAYDTRYLAIHMNRMWKPDDKWFRDYENAYRGRLMHIGVIGFDHRLARKFADSGRILPGTTAFGEAKQQIIGVADYNQGARIMNNSNLWEFAGNYRLKESQALPGLLVGANYRYYDISSEGTIFPDTTGNDISFYEYGAYAEMTKKFLSEQLHVVGSVRIDGSENFRISLTPRASAMYTIASEHSIRLSILTGTRYPGTKEQFIDQDLGPYRYLGGLPQMVNKYQLPENAFYQNAVEAYNLAFDNALNDRKNPSDPVEAMMNNLPILEEGLVEKGAFSQLSPERVISYELGYKSKISNKVFYDIVYYHSTYRDFIGFVRVNKPRISPSTDMYTALNQMNNSAMRDILYIHTNSSQKVAIQGLSLGAKWLTPLGSILTWNATWSDIRTRETDPIVPGFNTPAFKTNISVSNRKMDRMENNPGFKNMGFYINWRYQSAIDWESPFASGRVKPYATLDWQLSYNFSHPRATLKFGSTNFLNILHTSSYGGAQVGIFYYLSFTIENIETLFTSK